MLSVLAVLACSPAGPPSEDRDRQSWDWQWVTLGHSAPSTSFDGTSGSILLGPGWSYTERSQGSAAPGRPFVWATGQESVIWAETPDLPRLDFYARCRPLFYAVEPQVITLTADGKLLATATVPHDCQELRLPLPDAALEPGWNELRLRFSWAMKPSDLNLGADKRPLAMAFERLALVPRHVDDPEAFLNATTFDKRQGNLELPVGASMTIPLPARSDVTLGINEASCEGRHCPLTVELLSAEGRRTLHDGPLGGDRGGRHSGPAEAFQTTFSTPDKGLARLRLHHTADPSSDNPRNDKVLRLGFTPRDLDIRIRAHASAATPHIFVYMIDTLRADAVTLYGSARPTTPRLQAFAADAVVFLDAWSPSSWTFPAVASLMTGVYPHRHGSYLALHKLRPGSFTPLAERLRAAGHLTVAVSQSVVASDELGFGVGFDDFFLSDQLNGIELRSQEVRGFLARWLLYRWDGERPIFAYLHTVDPHAPYKPVGEASRFARGVPAGLPPERYHPHAFIKEGRQAEDPEVAHLRALYDDEVAHADQEFGLFLDMLRHLGLYKNSLIVVLSDHGEEFGEHGSFDHGFTLYEELIRVPLLVKLPAGRGAGRRVASRVSTLDLVPTLLDLLDIAFEPGDFDGVSLLPQIEADPSATPARPRLTLAETRAAVSRKHLAISYRALAFQDVKCIESLMPTDRFGEDVPRWQVFDLAADPRELNPLAAGDPRGKRCRETLGRWLAALDQADDAVESGAEPTAEATLEKLRALGYID